MSLKSSLQSQLGIGTSILQRRDHKHHVCGYRQLSLEGMNRTAGDTFREALIEGQALSTPLYLTEDNDSNPAEWEEPRIRSYFVGRWPDVEQTLDRQQDGPLQTWPHPLHLQHGGKNICLGAMVALSNGSAQHIVGMHHSSIFFNLLIRGESEVGSFMYIRRPHGIFPSPRLLL